MTDWQNLRGTFRKMFDHPQYDLYAREMHQLVIALQDDSALDRAEARVNFLYITITMPSGDGSIIIHNKKPGRFVVELYRGGWGKHLVDGELNVHIEALQPLIHHFLNRMALMRRPAA